MFSQAVQEKELPVIFWLGRVENEHQQCRILKGAIVLEDRLYTA